MRNEVAHYGRVVRHFSCDHSDTIPGGPEFKDILCHNLMSPWNFRRLTEEVRIVKGGLHVRLGAAWSCCWMWRGLWIRPVSCCGVHIHYPQVYGWKYRLKCGWRAYQPLRVQWFLAELDISISD